MYKGNYTTKVIIYLKESLNETYKIENSPNLSLTNNTIIVYADESKITDYLCMQRILNNYYIPTGIIFILLGIFLCFFGYFQKLMKGITCFICGELISLFILLLGYDFNIKYLEFLFLVIGLIIGGIFLYFSLLHINIYKTVLSITSGIIFGNYLLDFILIFIHSHLILSIYIDITIISISSFFLIVFQVLKRNYILCNSIIGGYILVRGLSILLFKVLRYRELQLILYFMDRNEWEFFETDKHDWDKFWVYDIIIAFSIIISIVFYYYHSKYYKKIMEENEEIEIEEREDKKKGKDERLMSLY